MIRFHRGVLALGAGFLVCACSACGPSVPERARPELLTADEVMSGSSEVRPESYWREASGCRPDEGYPLPLIKEGDPNLITFVQKGRWATLAVWDQDSYMYEGIIEDTYRKSRGSYCVLGPNKSAALEGKVEGSVDEWRVYPLDFGQSTAAFRSVTWRLKSIDTPPSVPVKGEGMLIYSTARVYGIVNGRLVRVEISHHEPEPPSEQELRALWDAQVAKIKFHDAVVHNHQVQSGHGVQSGGGAQSVHGEHGAQSAQSAQSEGSVQSGTADVPSSQ